MPRKVAKTKHEEGSITVAATSLYYYISEGQVLLISSSCTTSNNFILLSHLTHILLMRVAKEWSE